MAHIRLVTPTVPTSMAAVRLHSPGLGGLAFEEIETPRPREGEALIEVHAAAITRDELDWPLDRLPAIPSYELSGTVAAVARGVEAVAVGDPVYALTSFDRNGVAASYASVSADLLAPRPVRLDDIESAAVPLAALSAWQGLFDHGRLVKGERVLIHGAAGGVGHLATQLARWRGAHVIATASKNGLEAALAFGAHEVLDGANGLFEDAATAVDLVFDTVGAELLEHSPAALRKGGRLVSVAEEPPRTAPEAEIDSHYFVVEPNRRQLVEIAQLIDNEILCVAVDSVFPLSDARAAFERSLASGKRGKVVLRVAEASEGLPCAGG